MYLWLLPATALGVWMQGFTKCSIALIFFVMVGCGIGNSAFSCCGNGYQFSLVFEQERVAFRGFGQLKIAPVGVQTVHFGAFLAALGDLPQLLIVAISSPKVQVVKSELFNFLLPLGVFFDRAKRKIFEGLRTAFE